MKTLVKPQAKLNVKNYLKKPYQQNRLKSHSFQHLKFQTKWKFVLLAMSFFTLIFFSDTPEISADICNRFNTEQACKIW